jgi:hypothetical protein
MPSPPALPTSGSNKESLPAPVDLETFQGELKYPAQEYKAFMNDGEQVRLLYHTPPTTPWMRARKYLIIFCLISGMWFAFVLRHAEGNPVTLYLSLVVFMAPLGFALLFLIPWLEGRAFEKEEFLFTDRRVIYSSGNKRAALEYADITGISGDLALYQKNMYSILIFKTAKKLPGICRLEMRSVPMDNPVAERLKQLNLLNKRLR